MASMEEVMRYRLRIFEILPVEMARHRLGKIYPVGVLIVLVVVAFNFVGDALRDLLDVRLR